MIMFGLNDAALYGVSILGIYAILFLVKKEFIYKKVIIYSVFLLVGIAAAIISSVIQPDDFGTLITRSMIFQALSVYFLVVDRTSLHTVNTKHKELQTHGTN